MHMLLPARLARAARVPRACCTIAVGCVVRAPQAPFGCVCDACARKSGLHPPCPSPRGFVHLRLPARNARAACFPPVCRAVGGMNGAALRATGWATVCTDYCVCAVVCRLRVLSVDVPCVVVAQAYVCTALSGHGPNCPCIAALVINWYYGSGGAWVLSWADTRLCVALLACADDVIAFPPGIVVLVFSRAGCCIPVCATPPPPLWPLVGLHGRPMAHVAKWL